MTHSQSTGKYDARCTHMDATNQAHTVDLRESHYTYPQNRIEQRSSTANGIPRITKGYH